MAHPPRHTLGEKKLPRVLGIRASVLARLLAREQEHECGAHAHLARSFYGTPVSLGDLACDGESEAYSLLGPRGVSPVEALEDERQLVLEDPNPRIRDRQRYFKKEWVEEGSAWQSKLQDHSPCSGG